MKKISSNILISETWKILLPQTKFSGSNIGGSPVPATIALQLVDNQWIVGVVNGNFMKMVKLHVTGANTFEWIATKYNRNGDYQDCCVDAFSESCFVGIDSPLGECAYTVELVAEAQGTDIKLFHYFT